MVSSYKAAEGGFAAKTRQYITPNNTTTSQTYHRAGITSAREMTTKVLAEVGGRACTIDTLDFLEDILGSNDDEVDLASEVYKRLKDAGHYDTNIKLWKDFPLEISQEQELYAPFVNAATAIGDTLRTLGHEPRTSVLWTDGADISPISPNLAAPKLRPDILATIGQRNLDQEQQVTPHWTRVHSPIEVKKKSDDDTVAPAIAQLGNYMRMVLSEQVNRRFVLGLLFCGTELSAWMCDRSGLVGMQHAFDIHESPLLFIRTIMAFYRMDALRSGWDTDMKLLRTRNNQLEAVCTSDPTVLPADFGGDIYDTKWRITVRSQGGEVEVFETVKALSLARSAAMFGSGSTVWDVYNIKDTEKLYALKRLWRDDKAGFEADMVPGGLGNSPVVQILWSRDAYLDGGIRDETLGAIRGHTTVQDAATKIGEQPKRGKRKRSDANSADQRVHTAITDHTNFQTVSPYNPCNRIRTYTLMLTRGTELKRFKSVPVLLNAMRDAIQGHKDLWFRGVLHRDISPGNILITSQDEAGRAGCLIDLDHGKKYEDDMISAPTLRGAISQRAALLVEDMKNDFNIDFKETDAMKLLTRFGPGDAYCFLKAAAQFWPTVIPDFIIPELEPDARWPDVNADTEEGFVRTGTKAFMSAELLLQGRPYQNVGLRAAGPVKQDVIHDIESFFWVLIYMCLVRRDDGHLRDELRSDPPQGDAYAKTLHNIVYCLFDTSDDETLRSNKSELFENPADMEDYIIRYFDPSMECLKPFVRKWWKLLVFSYRTYNPWTPGVIHSQVLRLFNEEIVAFGKPVTRAVAGAPEPFHPSPERPKAKPAKPESPTYPVGTGFRLDPAAYAKSSSESESPAHKKAKSDNN
ncbi:hypothetical protein PUNSTDRAFT_146039 [Punctularia strigosozonata HHB-11173 SS5]|uniref:Fungal-type protein kinase domain-containing protein n=1 Tax=Punctularia strigosozonata (strain HHB-11173) TaxID=741275 RepID=R7S5D7_PUNST|nr:uncharacterized protein PUNSTDRAFT_146039 [Punctularia strigosozonata HHB-11173 SS5]EIN05137.1 hypothetical protein PUNSTDRAFT_146039 [Punctularia strigosozonata HHB-11173 SS5]